jgi:hypothetical protein
MERGVLTLAYGPDPYIRMAEGVARSIRLRNPEARLAVVTDRDSASLRRCFDVIIPLEPRYGPGLAQKLHLDLYSPFQRTLYLDSDCLVFRDIELLWNQFRGFEGLGLFGVPLAPGELHYAITDQKRFLAELGLSRMIMTNTGVLYFDASPDTTKAFETARALATRGDALGLRRHPVGFFNDEPIFGAVVELLGLPFISDIEDPAFTLACFGTDGMAGIDVRHGRSRHVSAGRTFAPVAIHFNIESQHSAIYDRELRRLEFGPRLARTPLPDTVTRARWLVRRLRGRYQRARGRQPQAANRP